MTTAIEPLNDANSEQPSESFAEIAFKICFLQVYRFRGCLTNFHILYKIRRYVDTKLEHFWGGSCYEAIANDIKNVKNVDDPYAAEIIYAWFTMWSSACKVDCITQRNQFFFICRVDMNKGDDLGFYSFVKDNTNQVIGPISLMRYSKEPNCEMLIYDNKIFFKATKPIEVGDYITVAKNFIVQIPFNKKEMETYETCVNCQDNKTQLIRNFVPNFTPRNRLNIIKNNDISDMDKKVFEELYHAFTKHDHCFRCLVHFATYLEEWPNRVRIILANEIAFQSWAFSRLLTIENPELIKKLEEDVAHGYITEDDYQNYKNNKNERLASLKHLPNYYENISDIEDDLDDYNVVRKRSKKPKTKLVKEQINAVGEDLTGLLDEIQTSTQQDILVSQVSQIFDSTDDEGRK